MMFQFLLFIYQIVACLALFFIFFFCCWEKGIWIGRIAPEHFPWIQVPVVQIFPHYHNYCLFQVFYLSKVFFWVWTYFWFEGYQLWNAKKIIVNMLWHFREGIAWLRIYDKIIVMDLWHGRGIVLPSLLKMQSSRERPHFGEQESSAHPIPSVTSLNPRTGNYHTSERNRPMIRYVKKY